MSGQSFPSDSNGRILREDEKRVLRFLIGHAHDSLLKENDAAIVEDMEDSGMGSVRFLHTAKVRIFGRILSEAEYVDIDGVLVNIAVVLDKEGELYEMDFWKVDFSPLQQYPRPDQLQLKS